MLVVPDEAPLLTSLPVAPLPVAPLPLPLPPPLPCSPLPPVLLPALHALAKASPSPKPKIPEKRSVRKLLIAFNHSFFPDHGPVIRAYFGIVKVFS
jgi:hypothetical protein